MLRPNPPLRRTLARILAWGSLLSIFALVSCISAFSPDLDAPPKRLVVDGLVTDDAGPHTVRLTYSAAFEQSLEGRTEPVAGATVTIEDDVGNRVALDDAGAGFYRTAPGALVGQVGRSYTLTVELPDGRVYQSRPARMPPVPPVDSAFAELAQRQPSMTSGFQVYAETEDPPDTTNRYRWKWSGVYETRIVQETDFPPFPNIPCWASDTPAKRQMSTLSLFEDTFIDGNRVTRQPVVFLPLDQKFILGYSMKITQYSLTRVAYAFWHQIQLQTEQSGSLFDPSPSRIRGNVVNVADSTDRALGYFGASAIDTTRFCMNLRDFPEAPPFHWTGPVASGPDCSVINALNDPPDFWTCSTTTGNPLSSSDLEDTGLAE